MRRSSANQPAPFLAFWAQPPSPPRLPLCHRYPLFLPLRALKLQTCPCLLCRRTCPPSHFLDLASSACRAAHSDPKAPPTSAHCRALNPSHQARTRHQQQQPLKGVSSAHTGPPTSKQSPGGIQPRPCRRCPDRGNASACPAQRHEAQATAVACDMLASPSLPRPLSPPSLAPQPRPDSPVPTRLITSSSSSSASSPAAATWPASAAWAALPPPPRHPPRHPPPPPRQSRPGRPGRRPQEARARGQASAGR